ncbi:MAG: 16S rRNA (cytidine(1402)-2'-O)-methyltransferase [Desulfobulbus propionicus]|nr:MAG: 16S rRNA (cytidine(1402)-2'-O)-methyltransferase [Desulfobulbus propionicus]
METSAPVGTLYVVATPIGNLGDLSGRACRILEEVKLIACEDTRHTRKLLSYFGLSTPMISYYREKEHQRSEQILARLRAGDDVALVSDAGTPGISDPGAVLVKAAYAAEIKVVAVAGPSALTAALSIAGCRDSSFYFAGFPPVKPGAQTRLFASLKHLTCPLVFYESPRRVSSTLKHLAGELGDRQAQLFRELTKRHEQRLSGSLTRLAEQTANGIKGEIVLVVDGAPAAVACSSTEVDELLLWHKDQQGASLKDAVRTIAKELGLSRSSVYRRALQLWHTPE